MDTGLLSCSYLCVVELRQQFAGGPEVLKTQCTKGASGFLSAWGLLAQQATSGFFVQMNHNGIDGFVNNDFYLSG